MLAEENDWAGMRASWGEDGRDEKGSMAVAAVDELVIEMETRSATTVAIGFDAVEAAVEAAVEVVAVGEGSGWRVQAEAAAVAGTFVAGFAAAAGFYTS